jgi:hypothetical protein
MDTTQQILLNSFRNVNSVNVDTFNKIELNNNISEITEFDIRNVLSVTEIFDAEREDNQIYRIYGKFDYLSLLNGLKLDYKYLKDYFTPQLTNAKTLVNSFEFYLLKPSTGYTKILNNNIEYVRHFEVIGATNDIEIFKAGFGKNVYGDQTHIYNFNIDFDVSNYYDNFGFPVNELYLYVKYLPKKNAFNDSENVYYLNWGTVGGSGTKTLLSTTTLNIGDRVYGDLIEYSRTTFSQTQKLPQTYYITTPVRNLNNVFSGNIMWKYQPFIPLTLRYFSNDIYNANSGDSSIELVESIPDYATLLDSNGNYVWRTILPQGYTDPLTNEGVDYPFVNKKRYLFSSSMIDIVPDLTDTYTYNAFKNTIISENILNITPLDNELDNIGKPCQ